LATTLSLLAVFVPVGFMTGIVGRFMSSFGLTAAAAIAISLIVSFTLTPMLAARLIKRGTNEHEETANEDADEQPAEAVGGHSKSGRVYGLIDSTYTFLLKLSMRFRWVIVLICIVTVASIYPLYKFVGMAFLPDEDESAYQVNLRGPEGTSLSATQSILDRMARDIRAELPGIANTFVLAGFGRGSGPNNGFINVSLVPVAEREFSQSELIAKTRQLTKKYSNDDYQVSVSASSSN